MGMTDEYCPILLLPCVMETESIRFLNGTDVVEITGEWASIFKAVLELCDGIHSVRDIRNVLGDNDSLVEEVLSTLENDLIICDSREQYKHFHRLSCYPTQFLRKLTQEEITDHLNSPRSLCKQGVVLQGNTTKSRIIELEKKRISCRSFSQDSITLDQLHSICKAAYCLRDYHAVPSGGALYPLKILISVVIQGKGLPSGLYEYNSEEDTLILYNSEIDKSELEYCFNMEPLGFDSPVQIIIAIDLDRQGYKYANRSYRLGLIEAGHVAENICLAASEQDLNTCELGGILDYPCKKAFDMPDEYFPVLGICLGHRSDTYRNEIDYLRFIEKNTGNDKEVKWVNVYPTESDFFTATAGYNEHGYDCVSGANSHSDVIAMFKAVVEAYERKYSTRFTCDKRSSGYELRKAGEKYITPLELVPLTPEQCAKANCYVWGEDITIDWVKGYYATSNTDVYVPTDVVFYGDNSNTRKRVFYSNSSGIAAGLDIYEAQKKAVAELIERDALMRCWYSHKSPSSHIPLSQHVKKRISYWKQKNRELRILSLYTKIGVPVFLATFWSNEYPFFTCGASCSLSNDTENIKIAEEKALMEAESALCYFINNPDEDSIVDIDAVRTPEDHGKFYRANYHNAQKLEWLRRGKEQDDVFATKEYDDILKECEIVFVNIANESNGIKVVKAISTKLIPISFGINLYCYSHSEIESLDPISIKHPHFFA